MNRIRFSLNTLMAVVALSACASLTLRYRDCDDSEIEAFNKALKSVSGSMTSVELHGRKSYYIYMMSPACTDLQLALIPRNIEIKALNLSHSEISDSGLDHLRAKRIHKLQLLHTKISDRGILALAQIKNLKSLGLARTLVKGETLDTLNGMQELKEIDLSRCALSESGSRKASSLGKQLKIIMD